MKTPFHFLVFKVFHAQRKRIRMDMDEYGLYPGQPKVLRYLHTHEDCKLKDIAEECDIECATASKLLTSLEENAMLKRKIDPSNKRAYQVRITDKGIEAMRRWNQHCEEVERCSLQGFSKEEQEQFISYLSRMYTNLSGKLLE